MTNQYAKCAKPGIVQIGEQEMPFDVLIWATGD